MISNLAFIHPDAQIGENVTIEPFAYIAGDVVIGDGTYVAPHASILDGARIGKNCQIHGGAVVAGVPQDLKFRGEKTTAEVGDNTVIREGATINRGTAAKGKTVVGANCLIMTCAHVAHDCVLGDYVILVNRVSLGGEVEVGDWAIIGGHCAVHQFCRIGSHAMISGGTLVNKDVPAYVKVAHYPVAYVGVNVVGLRRRNFTPEQITEIHNVMRILFQSGYMYSKGVEIAEREVPQSDFRDEILNFVRTSKRGVVKQYNPKNKDIELD